MSHYEYKVVPAPSKAARARGVKGTEARFAHALTALMNEMARTGWEYLRADTLPCEERQGLTGKTSSFKNMLVFRRALQDEPARAEPRHAAPAARSEQRQGAPVAAPSVTPPQPQTPDQIAAAAAASLTARPNAGPSPALGPADAQDPPARPSRDVAAE
ncbi:hypothetical protein Ga0609869_000369 [Rhodovulum iodosum]|uniref:DUF4177 domain-containing protein n=1 Tax=Rhodovulum iodosum TaxID=68291 RepID=A0ABV3XNX4_9RHOB|nr:DUF4177 domain-containing protein [Rhodovulum robiginosum]RSK37957.1 DUF4177 domain-containing protein [Rhodovulum robiginosum]